MKDEVKEEITKEEKAETKQTPKIDWAMEAKHELEDYIEEQGSQLRY